MSTATLKKRLEKTINETRSQLLEIEQAEHDEKNKKLVGRYFRYKNCYSCPEKPSDYWWMYMRVAGLKDGGLVVRTFQTDTFGRVLIDPSAWHRVMLEGCEEIKQQQYEKALAKALEVASAITD